MESAACLYRLFAHDDTLLYVGVTVDPAARWSHHSREKAWWPQVAHASADWFETRTEAEAAEVEAIASECPRYNVEHSTIRQRGDALGEYIRYERIRQVRIPDDLWEAAGKAAESMGTSRSAVIKELLRWCIREPGVGLPERPTLGGSPGTDQA